jgi:hypothetical protein
MRTKPISHHSAEALTRAHGERPTSRPSLSYQGLTARPRGEEGPKVSALTVPAPVLPVSFSNDYKPNKGNYSQPRGLIFAPAAQSISRSNDTTCKKPLLPAHDLENLILTPDS